MYVYFSAFQFSFRDSKIYIHRLSLQSTYWKKIMLKILNKNLFEERAIQSLSMTDYSESMYFFSFFFCIRALNRMKPAYKIMNMVHWITTFLFFFMISFRTILNLKNHSMVFVGSQTWQSPHSDIEIPDAVYSFKQNPSQSTSMFSTSRTLFFHKIWSITFTFLRQTTSIINYHSGSISVVKFRTRKGERTAKLISLSDKYFKSVVIFRTITTSRRKFFD